MICFKSATKIQSCGVALVLLVFLLFSGCTSESEVHQASYPSESSYAQIETLTNAHTRVVWVQDIGDGSDFAAQGVNLRLMGFDSRDGQGERVILDGPANYAKPLITPRGNRVVYTDRTQDAVMIINWDGSDPVRVASGYAMTLWMDSKTGHEWVYFGTELTSDRAPSRHRIERMRLDDHSVKELVWSQTPVTEDNFQISIDGKLAGGTFPWPHAGVAELPDKGWQRLARGCWPSISPNDQYLFWVFDGAHRNLTIQKYDTDSRWQVSINTAPGIDGFEVYHPRWSNHPRFMTMTGPYTVGGGGNKIRGGGKEVSVHIGRFSEDYRSIEAWVRLTGDGWADFYPDVWIESGLQLTLAHEEKTENGLATGAQARTVEPFPEAAKPEADEEKGTGRVFRPSLKVKARLVEASAIPTVEAIAPYDRALVANKYVVEEVISGDDAPQEIMVAHWVIREGRALDNAQRTKGEIFYLTLEPYEDRPELEGERLSMDSDEFAIPLYYDVQR